MNNKNKPTHPVLLRQTGENEYRVASDKDSREGIYLSSELGLTKREEFARSAMQGLCNGVTTADIKNGKCVDIAECAILIADELLKQLDNE